jgi:hypothetical protein
MNKNQATTKISYPEHLNEDPQMFTLDITQDGQTQRIRGSLTGGEWLTLYAESNGLNGPRIEWWVPRAAVGALWEAIANLDAATPDPDADQPYGGDDD